MPHRTPGPIPVLLLLMACSHSAPVPTGPGEPGGPFSPAQPTPLTLSSFDDIHPATSGAGYISYQFRRGTPDRDLCAGILPDRGGQRVAEVCAWELDDLSRSDLFGAAVLLGEDRLAFTRHEGGLGSPAPSDGGLYVGSARFPRTATRVLTLLDRPAGASARWDLLVDPRQTGPDEITALASQWVIGPTVAFGPPDTVLVGVEIAQINLATTPASITVIAPAPGAVAWALDPVDGAYYFLRPTYAPPADSLFKPIADTIFLASGTTTVPIYGRPTVPNTIGGRLDGFAIHGGRLFVARRWFEFPTVGPRILQTASQVAEVVDGVDRLPFGSRLGPNGDRWERLAITADGSGLIAESILGNARDLVRFEVDP